MSSSSNLGSGSCDCGEQTTSEPTLLSGPGLSALPYRAGTYATFLRRMRDQLAIQKVPPNDPAATDRPLAALKTRATSDPTVALLDAWSTVMDVFTFYQERIVNEGYLRTATERLSVLELGRASGYELHPGIAATCYLAFTAEDSASAPKVAAVPAGTKVQSLPGPGEKPQTFETMATLGARATWNQLRPRQTQPQSLHLNNTGDKLIHTGTTGEWNYLYLAGTGLNIKVGDMLLIIDRKAGVTPTDRPVTMSKLVQSVTPDAPAGRTRIGFGTDSDNATPYFPPDPVSPGVIDTRPTPLIHDYVRDKIVQRRWEEGKLSAQIGFQRWNEHDLLQHINQIVAETPDTIEVYALRQRVGFFGNNAPLYETLMGANGHRYYPDNATPQSWEDPAQRSIFKRSVIKDTAGDYVDYSDPVSSGLGGDVFLERSVPEVVPGSWVVFRRQAATIVYFVREILENPLMEFAVNGKATGLKLATPQSPDTALVTKPGNLGFRNTMAYVQSERMKLALWPIDDPLRATDSTIVLSGMTLGLRPGQPIWLRGEQADVAGLIQDQIVLLRDIVHDHGYTTLYLSEAIGRSYRRSSVTLNANVVWASHGESTSPEVLGSGDATKQNQSFDLKKPNVTYLLASNSSGTQSTVNVTVNGIPWTEVASLYDLDGRSQSFTLRTSETGITTVIFGDGEHGARLPTGTENVVATYRTCDAAMGAIAAGRLSQLKTRPLGIRDVINPLPATDNSAPDSIEQGRTNAPLQTELIGRIVTLQDYQGFASAFPGIAKAYARLLWNGSTNFVHITVSGQDGSAVAPDSPLQVSLLHAIDSVADPALFVQVMTYRPRYFVIAADLVLGPNNVSEQVLAAAQAALLSTFSFSRRRLAQDVTAAEVAAALQAVPGVAATVLRQLSFFDDLSSGAPPARLEAGDTHYDYTQSLPSLQPAELLLLSPAGITLSEIES